MLIWPAVVLAFVAIGVMAYGELTEDKAYRGFSFLVLAVVLALSAFGIWREITNGRAANDEAIRTGWPWPAILFVVAVCFVVFGTCNML